MSPAVTAVAAREPTLMTRDELAASIWRRDPSIHVLRTLAHDSALNEAGIGFPPYHGLCRSTTLAVS